MTPYKKTGCGDKQFMCEQIHARQSLISKGVLRTGHPGQYKVYPPGIKPAGHKYHNGTSIVVVNGAYFEDADLFEKDFSPA